MASRCRMWAKTAGIGILDGYATAVERERPANPIKRAHLSSGRP